MRQTNVRATSQVTTCYIGHMFGICFGPEKKATFMWSIRHKVCCFNEWKPALCWPLSSSNVYFASLMQANRSNIKFGIALKLRGHGDEPRLLCMNFAGLGLAIMIALFGERISKK